MPELAEVAFFRRRWDAGLAAVIIRVETHVAARVFRGCDQGLMRRKLRGTTLTTSATHGKQMLFGFAGGAWLGVHLGMTGELRVEAAGYQRAKHDHLVLRQKKRTLVFADARMFGRIRFDVSPAGPPQWWRDLPAEVLSRAFTLARLKGLLHRRAKSPLKAVLLDQRAFPGIGNWMADEILWRVQIHPLTLAGALDQSQVRLLWKQVRWISRRALAVIGGEWRELPKTWLFQHRWGAGRHCPRCGIPLIRAAAAGRTTCFCPACQPDPARRSPDRMIRTGHRRKRPVH